MHEHSVALKPAIGQHDVKKHRDFSVKTRLKNVRDFRLFFKRKTLTNATIEVKA